MSSELQNYGKTAMELQTEPRKSRNSKMTLEQYMDFFDSHKQLILPVNFLRQIVVMHGFKWIQSVPKDEVMDTLRSIDLMKPSRSTINDDNISSCAFITLKDAIKDLSILKWQECCITSLQTHNSVNYDHLTLTTTTTLASTCSNKPKSKRSSKKSSSSTAASLVTDHSANTPLEQLEMEPRLGEADRDISSAIVVLPAPDGCGTETRKRKRKNISSSMAP